MIINITYSMIIMNQGFFLLTQIRWPVSNTHMHTHAHMVRCLNSGKAQLTGTLSGCFSLILADSAALTSVTKEVNYIYFLLKFIQS
jgi:hypothetical protein